MSRHLPVYSVSVAPFPPQKRTVFVLDSWNVGPFTEPPAIFLVPVPEQLLAVVNKIILSENTLNWFNIRQGKRNSTGFNSMESGVRRAEAGLTLMIYISNGSKREQGFFGLTVTKYWSRHPIIESRAIFPKCSQCKCLLTWRQIRRKSTFPSTFPCPSNTLSRDSRHALAGTTAVHWYSIMTQWGGKKERTQG